MDKRNAEPHKIKVDRTKRDKADMTDHNPSLVKGLSILISDCRIRYDIVANVLLKELVINEGLAIKYADFGYWQTPRSDQRHNTTAGVCRVLFQDMDGRGLFSRSNFL